MEIARRADHTVVSVQMIQAKLLVSLFMQRNGGEERGCSQRVPIVKEMASVRLVQKSSAWPMRRDKKTRSTERRRSAKKRARPADISFSESLRLRRVCYDHSGGACASSGLGVFRHSEPQRTPIRRRRDNEGNQGAASSTAHQSKRIRAAGGKRQNVNQGRIRSRVVCMQHSWNHHKRNLCRQPFCSEFMGAGGRNKFVSCESRFGVDGGPAARKRHVHLHMCALSELSSRKKLDPSMGRFDFRRKIIGLAGNLLRRLLLCRGWEWACQKSCFASRQSERWTCRVSCWYFRSRPGDWTMRRMTFPPSSRVT
eukprot:6177134-Pleurochrysis_carterae.AAC.2